MQINFDDIIEAAKSGNEKALSEIMHEFMPTIKITAAKYASVNLEYDDIIQECMMALFRAILSFMQDNGAKFKTYACTCIENAAISAHRSANRQKHSLLNTAVPLHETSENINEQSAEDIVLSSESYIGALKHIQNILSPHEKNVLFAFLDGQTYTEIAKRLNITEKSVDNALQRIRAKLR